jgi:sec-independent protein translocase protein TatA
MNPSTFLALALGGPELLIVLVVVLLLFGTTRLPKLARSMGQAQKEFKAGIKEGDVDRDEKLADGEPVEPPAPTDRDR